MITKLDRLQGRDIYENTALAKLNEVIDAVNSIVSVQEKLIDSRFVVETKHEEPAENVQDRFAEQRKWIGKLCWVWDDDGDEHTFTKLREIIEDDDDRPFKCFSRWKHCEPVKPDDDIIYKGE